MSRKEYFKNYYKNNKKTIIKDATKYYKNNKKQCLSNQASYYRINKEEILTKKKMKVFTFKGHAHSIYSAVRKYSKRWKVPCCTWPEFLRWTLDDQGYSDHFDAWVTSNYNENLSPVVMRAVKKNGYSPTNLKWDKKNNYSWWNEDSTIFKQIEEALNEKQKIVNKGTKEWRKKVREQWKAQQDKKKLKRIPLYEREQ